MARLLYTSDAVVGPPRSTLSILTAPPGTYSYKALADLQDADGRPVSGGRLTTDQGGSLPDFFGPEGDVATLYALLPDGSTVTLSLAAENASPLTAADARGAYASFATLAANPDGIIFGAITRDSNGIVTSASVLWPDGSTGTYTATSVTSSGVLAYTVTKVTGGVTTTYTQPAMTRDASSGAVTVRPALTVA